MKYCDFTKGSEVKTGTFLLVIMAVLVVAAIWAIVAYNRLFRLAMLSDNAWSDVDVQLKRRHDLVPNLVETVKGYAAHLPLKH